MAEQSALITAFKAMGIVPEPQNVRDSARKYRRANPGLSSGELAEKLASAATWRMTGAGVVASLPGAIPGLGTAAQVAIGGATISGETWLMLRNLTVLQMTVAALYGHDPSDEDRLDELLITWGLMTGAVVPAKEATKRVGTKVAIKQFNTRVSGALVRKINQKLGTTVFTKWGTKRGGIALGRLIPFGVGAVVGGGMNYSTARSFANQVLRLYGDIIPKNESIYVDA